MFSLPEGDRPLLAIETVRLFSELAEACERLFAELGARVTDERDPHAKRLLSTASRVCGEYAGRWAELIPESVLLEPEARRAEARSAAAALPVFALPEAVIAAGLALGPRLSGASDGAACRLLQAFLPDFRRIADDLRGLR